MSYWSPNAPSPPEPPEMERRVGAHRVEAIGVALLAFLPLLAILNVFGPRTATLTHETDAIAIELTYPARYRFRVSAQVAMTLQNRTAQALPVEVRISRDYLDAFSEVGFTPDAAAVTDDVYVVRLDLPPGEGRAINVSLQGERYWLRRGSVTVAPQGGEPVRFDLRTWIFP